MEDGPEQATASSSSWLIAELFGVCLSIPGAEQKCTWAPDLDDQQGLSQPVYLYHFRLV